ncbi:MAG TPA: hypothetical protein VHS57_07895 [Acidimicrobiales bacterium]|nr:hypothetical protein [Acidimicrobiales bacterium]
MSHRIDRDLRRHRRLLPAAALVAALGAGSLLAVPLATSAGAGAATPVITKVLTNASNGTTTVVPKGVQIEVKLSSHGFRWTEASVINAGPEVVLKFESGHVNANGSSVTTFLSVGYGEVTLEATGTPKCTTVCPTVDMAWHANVIVYV